MLQRNFPYFGSSSVHNLVSSTSSTSLAINECNGLQIRIVRRKRYPRDAKSVYSWDSVLDTLK